jgi:predicted membrane chloride channel (bestrophin family)
LLFRFVGTSWPHGVIPGLLSCSVGVLLSFIPDVNDLISERTEFVENPYPFQLFAYLVGFILVFRTNFGYVRYWEAFDAVQRMGAKWLDGACMAVVFDAKGDASQPFLQSSVASDKHSLDYGRGSVPKGGIDHHDFFVEVMHLFSLMHALALQHLRCDSDISNLENHSEESQSMRMSMSALGDTPQLTYATNKLANFGFNHAHHKGVPMHLKVLGGLLPEEREKLTADSQGNLLSTVTRVTMVESWIMRRLIARQKHEPSGDMCKTAPPILSRMVQVVSDGNLGFSQASKAAEVPFPFPYHNMIRAFLFIFGLSVPFIINSKVFNPVARAIINFIVVWAYFALAEASDNLEDPFLPYDPNDLPLEAIQHSYNARLLSYGVVPLPEPKVIDRMVTDD